MSSAPFYKFFYDNFGGISPYTDDNSIPTPLAPYDFNKFVAANGREPTGAEDFQRWQVDSYLKDTGQTPQQWLSKYTVGKDPVTMDAAGNVNYTNHGDGAFGGFGGLVMIGLLAAGIAAGGAIAGGAAGGTAAADAALGELGINTALEAGSVAGTGGSIAAGTAVGDLAAGYSLGGTLAAAANATAGSFGDIIAAQFTPEKLGMNLAKSAVTSAITGRPLSVEGLATSTVAGGIGSATNVAAGGGLLGNLAGTATSTAAGTAINSALGGDVSAPSRSPTPQQMAATLPSENAVPGSFSLVLSPYKPQFQRNTAGA